MPPRTRRAVVRKESAETHEYVSVSTMTNHVNQNMDAEDKRSMEKMSFSGLRRTVRTGRSEDYRETPDSREWSEAEQEFLRKQQGARPCLDAPIFQRLQKKKFSGNLPGDCG